MFGQHRHQSLSADTYFPSSIEAREYKDGACSVSRGLGVYLRCLVIRFLMQHLSHIEHWGDDGGGFGLLTALVVDRPTC